MKTKVYCDIGINHQGELALAIELGKNFGRHCDAVKLQMRTPDICVPSSQWNRKKTMPLAGNEVSYLEYKELTELHNAELLDFAKVMKKNKIKWFSSVWDIPSLQRYLGFQNDSETIIKIPSALCKNKKLAKAIEEIDFKGQVIVSLGDCKSVDEMLMVYNSLWVDMGATPMYCLPCYGADVYMPEEIIDFKSSFEVFENGVGYSTHSGRLRDIEFAVAFGYDIVEYHCTFSKLMDGSDHSSSFTLSQAAELRKHIADIEKRVCKNRSKLWENIDEKLSTLRPERVL